MSLYKQVSIVILFIFTILFLLITIVSFKIIKDSSEKSLYENVQNSASSISLSITNAGTEISTIKTVINASFDNGNYEKIVFKDMDNVLVYNVQKDTSFNQNKIPLWFIKIIKIGDISSTTTISSGWNVLGTIEIFSDKSIFYNQTYSILKNLIFYVTISLIILMGIFFFFFAYILRPLHEIKKQALAVMENEFILQKKLPFTSEFKSVTLSMNSMIGKIEKMFENTNNVLKVNNQLLYFDEVSKLHNRKYFILKLNEYLDKDNFNNKGYIVIISIKINEINKEYGYLETNKILFSLSKLIKEEYEYGTNLLTRVNGSEFVILVPNIEEEKMRESIEKFIKQLHEKLELSFDNMFIGVLKYEEEQNTRTLLTKMDYTISQAKTFKKDECYFVKEIDSYLTKEEWIKIINISLEKDSFKILYRNVIDINLKEILHKTISFELNLKNNNFSYKGLLPAILAQGKLNDVYLHIIERLLKDEKIKREKITIQLPVTFVADFNNYSKLNELFKKYESQYSKDIIFEIEEESFNKNLNNTTMYIKLFKEYKFAFAVFNFIANTNDYNYLKELKPLYIKTSKYFLLESTQSLNVLKILTESLDIKLIATSVTSFKDIDVLSDIGINALSGPVMENLQMDKK